MNNIVVVLFAMVIVVTPYCVQAQYGKNIPLKKSNTTKDLNKLEVEKIKAISINGVQQKDVVFNVVKKDSFANIKPVVVTINKSDSILKKVVPLHISEDKFPGLKNEMVNKKKELVSSDTNAVLLKNEKINTEPLKIIAIETKENLYKNDSLYYSKYNSKAKFADSIRNANKHWLDSTLTSLPKNKPVILQDDDEIEIFVSGGGFYAGVNAKIFDRLTIYRSGLVHREFKTKLQGEQVEEKKISKEELKKLAQFIINMGFFDFNNLYDCNAKDINCTSRLKSKPEPVSLSVSIAVGARRKKIYVAFFAPKMESNYVNYPTSLEKIVDAIYSTVK